MVGQRELVAVGAMLLLTSPFVGFVTSMHEEHSTLWALPDDDISRHEAVPCGDTDRVSTG